MNWNDHDQIEYTLTMLGVKLAVHLTLKSDTGSIQEPTATSIDGGTAEHSQLNFPEPCSTKPNAAILHPLQSCAAAAG